MPEKAGRPRRSRLPTDLADQGAGDPAVNRVVLAGRLLEREGVRYTPAGVPVVEFRLAHASEQVEAEVVRRVECEINCVTLGATALLLREAPLAGYLMVVEGFLAAKSVRQSMPVLHVTKIVFAEY